MVDALSDEQRSAVQSSSTRLTIVAPPGCGKTEVLAYRVAHLIDALEPGQRILALTFTNRAKANLMNRLRQTLGPAGTRRYVSVQNFHGHATAVLLSHGRTIGLCPEDWVLPKTSTLRDALSALDTDWPRRAAATEMLAGLKRSPVSDDELLACLRGRDANEVQQLAIQVEEGRQAAHQLHYDDLLRHAQRIMQVDAVAHLYQRHYGAVVVDEFQDMSLQQLDLAERTCIASRTFAGDPAQGIFSWTGADPDEVQRRLREECGPPLRLQESYRSSPRVLTTVNNVSALLGQTPLTSAQPDAWPDAGCSARLLFDTREAEAAAIAQLAEVITRDPAASVGVLFRSAWRGSAVVEALGAEGIPFRRWDLAVDDPEILEVIRGVAARLPRGASVGEAQAACLAELDRADVDSRELLLDAFQILGSAGHHTIRGALRRIRVVDPHEPVGPGVHVLSAHKGKGQQFDWAIVVGLEQGHVPDFRAKGKSAIEEELRVLLVMLSRARHGVVVTASRTARRKDPSHRPYAVDPSTWWTAITAEYEHLDDVLGHLRRATDVHAQKGKP